MKPVKWKPEKVSPYAMRYTSREIIRGTYVALTLLRRDHPELIHPNTYRAAVKKLKRLHQLSQINIPFLERLLEALKKKHPPEPLDPFLRD